LQNLGVFMYLKGQPNLSAMNSEASFKLLGHLYDIVPAKKSRALITQEVFSSDDNISVDDLLRELMTEGYVYKWKYYEEDKSDEYGMTPQGVVYYDRYAYQANHPASVARQVDPKAEKIVAPAEMMDQSEQQPERKFTFRSAIPAIILIAFAVGLVYIITRLRR
jgi:hypothetical protein